MTCLHYNNKTFQETIPDRRCEGIVIMLLFFLIPGLIFGQKSINPDNQDEYSKISDREIRDLLFEADQYYFTNPLKTIELANKVIDRSVKNGFTESEIIGRNIVGESYRFLGDYPQSLKLHFKALQLSRSTKNIKREAITLGFIGVTHLDLKEFPVAMDYLMQAKTLYDRLKPRLKAFDPFNLTNISEAYRGLGRLDSAKAVASRALNISLLNDHPILTILCMRRLAYVQDLLGNKTQAVELYHKAITLIDLHDDKVNYSTVRNQLAEIYYTTGVIDSGIYYCRQALNHAISLSQYPEILNASKILAGLFRSKKNPDSVIYYQDLAFKMQEKLFGPYQIRAVSLIAMREYQRQQTILAEQENYKTRVRQLFMLTGLLIFLSVSLILYRRFRQKKKANKLLEEKNKKIEESLSALKSTQAQLIQSEKMASLGELTAGIAHEIQNPLNFVNNFSEVNKELLDEMESELNAGNKEEAISIAKDIKENEEKINHHGKRADAIVKGMLQHSRTSSSVKEPTDINALADEYLRLSYHGFRAKDKTFNATLQTNFDESVRKINMIPQDIGRVLLNLYNNAFYAITEKNASTDSVGQKYEPTVSLSTKKVNGKVEIRVKDNGNGIPQKVLDKIFQPFFTTKPTGQGTGLGLSLSYDIIKAHGGEIKVDTKEGEFAEFIIVIPEGIF
jgi:two-component system NtrC family sensor kinase